MVVDQQTWDILIFVEQSLDKLCFVSLCSLLNSNQLFYKFSTTHMQLRDGSRASEPWLQVI